MLFGEFVLTDALLAFLSHHWRRFTNDLSVE
jgi:hypothetical protein